MSHPSEASLENNLVQQLAAQGYASIKVPDGAALVANLKAQLEAFNGTTFTAKEFDAILNHLAKGNVFEKAKTLRDRYKLSKEDGESFYVRFFDHEDLGRNLFQVTQQVEQQGSFRNRYDVTLLVNGLPLVQIELKRTGIEIKEAFNQVGRYHKHSFWANHGLYYYVQVFVISNGANTKYFSNQKEQSVRQTFYWANADNRNITGLSDFAAIFLQPTFLGKFIAHYVVMEEAHKRMLVMRPYQVHATEAIVRQVLAGRENGYIWHTTGSGKTLTSFKASQIVMDLPQVHKVIFVVDRKDLDYQTQQEFNSFKENSVDVTKDTRALVRQLTDDTKLVLTTIQKLDNAVTMAQYEGRLTQLRDKRIVFIFDECHRSQFGLTHRRITDFFRNSQLFGFTGTPIFVDNANKNEFGKRTTQELFGKRLHQYVITDAIHDQNVLKFGIEYVGRYRHKGSSFIDIEVEDIDKAEVLNDRKRLEKIADYILAYHDVKTFDREYSALFATSSIDNLIQYYEIFQARKLEGRHDLRIAAIFTYGANEDNEDAQDFLPEAEAIDFRHAAGQAMVAAEPPSPYGSTHSRDKLEAIIIDYNGQYNTAFSTRDGLQFEGYAKDISKRLKDREKASFDDDKDRLDLVLVVNMMLTGFDAKKVNTLYVDKNLKQHGLIQAFSRTNRILGEKKSQGNILCFRNLKAATDEAITLFSNKEAIETVVLPPYEVIVQRFGQALEALIDRVPTYQHVDDLQSEEEELAFVQAFRDLLRVKNVLASYTDFKWDDLGISEETFNNYLSKYLDLRDKVMQDHEKQKVSILNDIDFELELVHRDQINVAYILKLLAKLKEAKLTERAQQEKTIRDLLDREVMLRSKRALIEQFIAEHLPRIADSDHIADAFEAYWNDQKVLALHTLCAEEQLDKSQFQSLIEAYLFSGQEPLREAILRCLGARPSVLHARAVADRIMARMKEYVEVFYRGMVG